MRRFAAALLLHAPTVATRPVANPRLQRIVVSVSVSIFKRRRAPFSWLGETARLLAQNLDRAEAERFRESARHEARLLGSRGLSGGHG
jgi:hypothetical protein